MNKSEVIRLLLIEDNPGDARIIQEMLIEAGSNQFALEQYDRLSAGLERLNSGGVDVLLLDLGLPDSNGIDTFLRVYAKAPEVPTVVLTGLDDQRLAVKLVNKGAQDYLVKGQFDNNLLMRTIHYSIERKRSEKVIRESETRFRNLIKMNADAIIIVDCKGIVRFANPAAEALFRRTADEFVGEAFGFPVVADEIAEIDIVYKGGETAIAEMRSAEIEWEGETAHLASLRDITEIFKAREKIDLLANLVENASYVMIFIVNPDGQIVECNALAGNTFGYSKSAMLTMNLGALLNFKADERWEKIADSVQHESRWRGELVAVHKDGKEFPVDMAASRSSGEEYGGTSIICFIRDVSREKEIDRMKTEFISSASHEMRTPLTSIKNAVDIILKRKVGDITDVQERFLSMAQRNIERFSNLINNVLDISKIESGKMRLNYTEMDIRASIENVMNMFKSAADEKSISLQMNIKPTLPTIYADASRIEEVIINLVDNAVKFTPDDGVVTVDVHELKEISDMPEGVKGFLSISVTDNGVGIPAEGINHIFDKFYQVESSLSEHKKSGSGLGLTISKYTIEAHGGEIQCRSREGEGSTFSLTLPIIDQEQVCYKILNYELSNARQAQRTLSVSIFKIKDFEHFLEVYGKKRGEKELNTVKEAIIKRGVKKTDTVIVSPLDGEILVVMPDTNGTGAEIVQRRIEDYITGNKNLIEGKPCQLCFISGTAIFPEDGTSSEELIDRVRKQLNIDN